MQIFCVSNSKPINDSNTQQRYASQIKRTYATDFATNLTIFSEIVEVPGKFTNTILIIKNLELKQ